MRTAETVTFGGTLTWHFDQFRLSLRSQPPLNQAVAIKADREGKRGKS
jgi:hypothetical protein